MNDDQIGEVLRKTLAARAATVTQGAPWDEDEEPPDIAPYRHCRVRWLAPLAAAAVVLTVVGVTFALRGKDEQSAPPLPGAVEQPAVPAGMKPVDALGVEIFVPRTFGIDNPCAGGTKVLRPIPTSSLCPGPQQSVPLVRITTPQGHPGSNSCAHPIRLDREPACPMSAASTGRSGPTSTTLIWPKHGAQLTVANLDSKATMQILRSAHAVPVDRNGCRATNTDLDRALPRNIPDPANIQLHGLPLPTSGLDRMSVCWYISNRLAASAQVGGAGGRHIAQTVNALLPKWPAPQPQPNLPSCDQVDRHDGVQLIAHTRAGDVEAIAQLAACNGQRTVNAGSRAVLVEPELAAALARATGIPFADGYPAN
ncbi:hypothetical protein M6B22_01575 [Jatrophihabitans cynanchi]|uniref:Uncharacterized protein n=1 Tax=Jatrophihabitans cynanchi TaxID=2944128 RepID=A0ABY7JZU3_9ACTN|nr:hypothetical protein [Jatrophihabitans sp. SB3-54]WAX57470.1 hypothetical protein M6B22_01575 [Jatrophihabitans sp. SB3-54]